VVADDIQNGILDTAKFAAAGKPVEFGATLPTVADNDDLFYRTGDNTLFKRVSGVWVDNEGGQPIGFPQVITGRVRAAAITTTELAAGAVRAVNLASETLITQTAQIGTATIDTLRVQGDAVTTFASSFNPSVATGNGSYAVVVGVGLTVPSVGSRSGLLQVGWQHGYFSSTPTNFRIRWRQPPSLAEVIVTDRQMGQINDTPSFFRTITLEPGFHEFFMDWSGANGNVQASDFNIAVFSRIR
jgi:hypothetical protein